MANIDKIVDISSEENEKKAMTTESALVDWVMGRVEDWEDYRNVNYRTKWNEYYRLWRGVWSSEDKTRDSERSRLISPALSQAIEAAVAELEEATFGAGHFFDVADDYIDKQTQQVDPAMDQFRQLLHEDLVEDGVEQAMSEIFLNGAIYGTGIGKLIVENAEERSVSPVSISGVAMFGAEELERVHVRLVPVSPEEFVIDPAATTVENALGMAHVTNVPRHIVLAKQQDGSYFDEEVGAFADEEDFTASKGELKPVSNADRVRIVEYHGLVPRNLLPLELSDDEEVEEFDFEENKVVADEDDLVEAIITIANNSVLLQANENPFEMKDRAFVAYQHDTIPNRFWGRGVAEKGYNPQKALDAELRGRIDAMALAIHPMMAMDATRIPRGGDLSVRPGRTLLTNGDPRTILMPFNFGQVGTNTFTQAGDLERQIQMGTGSMDSATPIGVSRRNETASGMSMMLGGAIKRSKRTMANIERYFTGPLIHKAAWRYMELDPDRYPVRDVKFKVQSTLGIMAREVETQQLTSLLQTVPPESPAFWVLLRSIYDNSSISNKEEMLALVDQMAQQSMQPNPDPMVQLKMQELQQKLQLDAQRVKVELLRAQAEIARAEIDAQAMVSENAKRESETILNIAKAEAQEIGTQLDQYQAVTDALQAEAQSESNSGRSQVGSTTRPVQPSGMEGVSGGGPVSPQ